jgi:signal transduction histidine kinase
MTEKKLKEKKIKLKTHYADDIPPIVAVSDQIRQVILNLLQNAEGAITEEGGKIAITTQRDGSCIKIYVQDTGCGILTENMKSIFEPFFTTKASVKGTGLGLFVSYGIVKKHGGNIEIQSQPGKGTIFTVTLPINGVTK